MSTQAATAEGRLYTPPVAKRTNVVGQTIGSILVGFDQAVFRTQPPSEELVHHARPDDPVPATGVTC